MTEKEKPRLENWSDWFGRGQGGLTEMGRHPALDHLRRVLLGGQDQREEHEQTHSVPVVDAVAELVVWVLADDDGRGPWGQLGYVHSG